MHIKTSIVADCRYEYQKQGPQGFQVGIQTWSPMSMLVSELDPSCSFDTSRLKDVLLRTLLKSHPNLETPEVCRLAFVRLIKEWLD